MPLPCICSSWPLKGWLCSCHEASLVSRAKSRHWVKLQCSLKIGGKKPLRLGKKCPCNVSWLNDSPIRIQPCCRDANSWKSRNNWLLVRNAASRTVSTHSSLFSAKELPHGGSSTSLVKTPAVLHHSHCPGPAVSQLLQPTSERGREENREIISGTALWQLVPSGGCWVELKEEHWWRSGEKKPALLCWEPNFQ